MSELNILPLISDRLTTTSHSLVPFTRRRAGAGAGAASVRMEQSRPKSRKDKVVVILGATGAGKSRLSVDLATRFEAEIINSDKIQVYQGLEITTNQITIPERRGVPHHLLGQIRAEEGELSAADFRSAASSAVSDIVSRGKLPIVAGGSNSFVHALLAERFDPKTDPFGSCICRELRYECCFLWVHVSEGVLHEYLVKRVDEMMESGMLEELSGFYDPVKSGTARSGIRKAIGVPELEAFFRMYPPGEEGNKDPLRKAAYEKAVEDIKESTWRLARKQIGRIEKLQEKGGWPIHRVDATASFTESCWSRRREIWEKQVLEPSVNFVNRLLLDD